MLPIKLMKQPVPLLDRRKTLRCRCICGTQVIREQNRSDMGKATSMRMIFRNILSNSNIYRQRCSGRVSISRRKTAKKRKSKNAYGGYGEIAMTLEYFVIDHPAEVKVPVGLCRFFADVARVEKEED